MKTKKTKPTMFRRMLQKVAKVPYGKVSTYGDIAYAAGFPGAARQAAWALHADGEGLPWHRIVGAGGKILLTGEHGFEQRMRLEMEGVSFLGLKVNMAAHQHGFTKKKAGTRGAQVSRAKNTRAEPGAQRKGSGKNSTSVQRAQTGARQKQGNSVNSGQPKQHGRVKLHPSQG